MVAGGGLLALFRRDVFCKSMFMWADAEDDDLPPIPWFHVFRYNVMNVEVLESQEKTITCVQFELTTDDWTTLRFDASTVAQAVIAAETYLSQIVDDTFLDSIDKGRIRGLTRRYQYLEPVADVMIDVRDNTVIVLHN